MSFIKFAQMQFTGFLNNQEEEQDFEADSVSSKKALAQFKQKVVEHRKRLALAKDFMYIRTRAIGGLEKWGPNQNGDGFPLKELQASYSTFIGKGNFIDHKSDDIQKIRGLVVDAFMNNEDNCIECLIAVDKVSHPQLARDIETGVVNSVSMGTRVGWSACSVCGNVAKTEKDYCSHIQGYKGMKISMFTNNAEHKFGSWPVHEVNHELEFIELSWVSVPAFKDAHVLEKVASLKNIVDQDQMSKVSVYDAALLQRALGALEKHKYGLPSPEFTEAQAIEIVERQLDNIKLDKNKVHPTSTTQEPTEMQIAASIPNSLREIHQAAQCRDTECSNDIRKKGDTKMAEITKTAEMRRINISVKNLTRRMDMNDFKADGFVTIDEKEYTWIAVSADKKEWHIK